MAHFLQSIILVGGIISLAIQQGFVEALEITPESSHNVNDTCHRIASSLSHASQVSFPFSLEYLADIHHYGSSSSQDSTCSVEPGSSADLSHLLLILGETRTPFAVKGGGHASNLGFSSTTGVQISMSRFSSIVINHSAQTVELGAGLVWDDVYAVLDQHGLGVLGGRFTGIGVAGFTLGGGYSYKSNEYGLAIDHVQAYELVLPNGTVIGVTETSDPDLFFGLKGGYNNFGIVTKFTVNTFPQADVWGGTLSVSADNALNFAYTAARLFENITDPKAALFLSLVVSDGAISSNAQIFYDSPTPPAGFLDELLAIPRLAGSVSTRPFLDLILTADVGNPTRIVYNTVPVLNFSSVMMDAIVNETTFWGEYLGKRDPTTRVTYSVEPFLPNLLTHGAPSAFPPSRARAFLPLFIFFAWTDPALDQIMHDAARQSGAQLTAVAGTAGAPLYPNYAIASTPLTHMFGSNVGRLKAIAERFDPQTVMGLAGGWKFN